MQAEGEAPAVNVFLIGLTLLCGIAGMHCEVGGLQCLVFCQPLGLMASGDAWDQRLREGSPSLSMLSSAVEFLLFIRCPFFYSRKQCFVELKLHVIMSDQIWLHLAMEH